jgi:hypothetical protein
MWDTEPIDANEGLRQGDLLKDLVLPALRLPMSFINPAGQSPSQGDLIVVKSVQRDFLVVSQCCTSSTRSPLH